MRRTQIYLTEEQAERVAEMAADRGTTKAEVIRSILDASLRAGTDDEAVGDRLVIAETSGACSGYPDWPEWLAAIRGAATAERLAQLGL